MEDSTRYRYSKNMVLCLMEGALMTHFVRVEIITANDMEVKLLFRFVACNRACESVSYELQIISSISLHMKLYG